ncbi:tRNA (adenosine(37)-N6)-dimethylallyltransferase MiaA [Flavobacterium coralii]|uniref:tRNA (adenosine(37)-N6)-dimethylallyltransferase MiaA n=1 Tax=Flavobacterium coralii TaxID=2838017 RepID=UPI000C5A22E9|nr:tRNA (adenosine(37)-N6)-dimethylallyltransferase MiaA [Flavobacterium sp.]|tara:strand:- start:12272 stop:13201 length:930 start_codon:yes stop_codon:yes gene_type:complete
MTDNKNNKYLITVVGPTAIGKTALAIQLAQHYTCPIISADSRQFFKEMSIGTAVPSEEELAAAKHYFIQNISIKDTYTVGDFERDAIALLDDLYKEHDVVVMVGGSGLYIDAVLKGFDDFPDIDESVREYIIANYNRQGITWLQQELEKRDPEHYERVAKENPQRMMRSLEVCIGTGRPYSSFLNIKKNSRSFTPILIGLYADRELMYERINRRVDIMMDSGLPEEAKALYPYKEYNALQTVGYRELFSYFDGDYSLETAIEEIKKNTRRFAKRQMTWFRRNEAITWFNFTVPAEIIIQHINETIHADS